MKGPERREAAPASSAPLDLANCSVFVDFDGTISREDVGIELLERYCAGRYEAVDDRYERGEIGSREYVAALWPLFEGTPLEELSAAAEGVALDPGFGPLVAFLREGRAEIAVVSDGLGFYVAGRCAPFGVDVIANGVDSGRGHAGRRPVFGAAATDCPCGECGTCKADPVRRARARGRTAVVVGDGTSDRFAAAEANLVFAKDRLRDWCEEAGIVHHRFDRLGDVEAELRRRAGASERLSDPRS